MPGPPTTREVRRIADFEGRTLCYMVHLGSRKAGWRTFRPEEVPPFEGRTGWFEVEIDRKGRWRFLRQVERPAWAGASSR
jgi:hypothetical protein